MQRPPNIYRGTVTLRPDELGDRVPGYSCGKRGGKKFQEDNLHQGDGYEQNRQDDANFYQFTKNKAILFFSAAACHFWLLFLRYYENSDKLDTNPKFRHNCESRHPERMSTLNLYLRANGIKEKIKIFCETIDSAVQ